MAQLRADIHQTENEKKRKRDAKKLQTNVALPIFESSDQRVINAESQADVQQMLEDTQDLSGYITTEQDWKERLKEWNELLIEEEKALLDADKILDGGIILDNDLLSSYIHPAVDINAKWNLRDLFIRELEKPEFISVSPEFN